MRIEIHHILKWSFLIFVAHQANSQQNYDRDRTDNYNRDQNRDSNDPYNRSRDPYDNRNNQYDPYNRNNQTDPYNRNQSNQYGQGNNDPYNRNNDPYNRNNDPYNRNQSGFNRNTDPNDPYNRNNPNRNNDPYNRNYDPNNRDPNNRNQNDPYNRNNDPYNRSQDPNNRNDPYNRNNNSNDPYNRNNNNDPYNRNNQNDPYNRNYNANDPYNRDHNGSQYGSSNYDRTGSNYDRSGSNYGSGGNYGSGSNYGSGGSKFGGDDGNCCEEYCYDIDEQPFVKLGSKTPYQFAYGKISNQHIVPQCKPVQVWSLSREGTSVPDRMALERYKALNKIHDELIRNYEERRSFPSKGRLCAGDYENLKRWRWNDSMSEHNAGSLTHQGSEDLKFIARRYQTRLRELLVPYNEQQYYFQYTEGDRSQESYQAYIQGLFGADAQRVHANVRNNPNSQGGYNSYNTNNNNPNNANYNPFNAFSNNENSYQSAYAQGQSAQYGSSYSKCKTFQQRLDEQRETSVEYQAFKQKQDYRDMVRNVFRRLGFKYTLNDTIIEDMYDLCRYEKSWYVTRPSPWCGAFTKEQLKLLEYGDDLFNYYKSGYGHEHLNKNLGCGLVKDMYDRFERTVNGNSNEQKAIYHFRDLDTFLKTLVSFDIGRDQSTLTADNYYQLTTRNWRGSTLSPFSGNLAAILYQCDTQQSNDKFKVMFFLNENPVDFPDCSVGLCSWQSIVQKFQRVSQECRLDWCERGAANTHTISHIPILISAVIVTLYKLAF